MAREDLITAYLCFSRSYQLSVQSSDVEHSIRLSGSYLGYLQVLCSQAEGLDLARRSAYFEADQAEVFFNLARAELQQGKRLRALHAIRQGLTIDPDHKQLLELRMRLGMRRRLLFKSLSREHWCNRLLGWIRYCWTQ